MELVRWQWPFGGVPLSNFAVSQVSGPLAPVLRVGGSLLLVFIAAATAMAIAATIRRDRMALVPAALVVVAMAIGLVAPRGSSFDTIDVALVQGGGPQGTRADETDPRDVIERHLAASELIETPVDLVLWPEDVVDVDQLAGSQENRELSELADSLDATLVVGIIEDDGPDTFRNAAIVYSPEGEIVDRYEKVERVPFGEWVPFRPLLEAVAGDALPERDAAIGDGPAIVETEVGTFGVAISWEIFFGARARDAIGNGGEILLNPTNGSSFEGTLVQTQQIASSRIRAIETGRWVVQAAPTGFTAVISPDGDVLQRTAVSEQAVLHATVERRSGLTLANRLGVWPPTLLAAVTLGWAWRERLTRPFRSRRSPSPGHR
jgi:apolipoprotein N-acyltransferase